MSLDLSTAESDSITLNPLPLLSNKIDSESANNSSKKNYPFVDMVRFIAMIGVVWAHTNLGGPSEKSQGIDMLKPTIGILSFIQICKFDVICFFLISGFLFSERKKSDRPIDYFKRRVNKLLKPYLFVVVVSLACRLGAAILIKHETVDYKEFINITTVLFTESFLWFVPNYLVCLAVLFIFNKYLNSIYFGLSLLAVTLAYSILTVYIKGFLASHTTAILGFVFYLWLGYYIKRKNVIENVVEKFPAYLFISVTIIFYIISCIEANILYNHNLSYLSTLRIFNQLYAVSMFFMLTKLFLNSKSTIKFLNPRKETYGIYLYHNLVLGIPRRLTDYMHINQYSTNIYFFMLDFVAWLIICYLLTTLLVKFLLNYKLAFL